tara:strand:+ start:1470 stop:2207 length:738 start_codon:yes stop_codon:yes gene_type:complete
MNLNIRHEPFKYGILNQILTKEENDTLYNLCLNSYNDNKSSIDDLTFFILPNEKDEYDKLSDRLKYRAHDLGLYQNNNGLILRHDEIEHYHDLQRKIINRFKTKEFLDQFPIVYRKNGKPMDWNMGLCISPYLPKTQLLPHNDNPAELAKYGEENNINVSSGVYKGVIYIADDNLDYTDYGTRFYNINQPKNPNLPDSLRYTEIEEIKFKSGNGCMFETGPLSYHGTYYPNQLLNNRYTITLEYY